MIPERFRIVRNIFLCIASLLFYAWGEPRFVLVMIASITANWFFGLMVGRSRSEKRKKILLAIDVVWNLGLLYVFKYFNFTMDNIGLITGHRPPFAEIALPIGISFFTFQAMSYVIDVYRQKGEPQKNLLNVALYISFFPQLIAGPIVRYETIEKQINGRQESLTLFSEGACRFIVGLSKKVIIANNLALVADQAFETMSTGTWMGESISMPWGMAWLGAICYTFQIFFDFSGYSDMAIGLGKMFGFRFLENFNYPYISDSITEFWRRWHISLSSWFRDYVYIPLGGNRVSGSRHVFNLFVVWLLTGVWHGANWTFILWGMIYFVLLIFEKYTGITDMLKKQKTGKILCHIYTLFFVVMAWVVFRAENLGQALSYFKAMFGFAGDMGSTSITAFYLREFWVYIFAAIIASVPLVPWLKEKICMKGNAAAGAAYVVALVLMLIISISFIVKGSYNPFIYFNF